MQVTMATSTKEADRDAALRRIAKALSTVGYALPGTLTVRAYSCGKANCRCKSDPAARHGPYAYWTRKVGSTTKTPGFSPMTSSRTTDSGSTTPAGPTSVVDEDQHWCRPLVVRSGGSSDLVPGGSVWRRDISGWRLVPRTGFEVDKKGDDGVLAPDGAEVEMPRLGGGVGCGVKVGDGP